MKRTALSWLLVMLAGSVPGAEPGFPRGASPILNPEKEGLELALQLRTSSPTEDSEFTGVLEIVSREGKARSVPIASTLTVSPTNWAVTYRSAPTNGQPAETLTIVHTPGRASLYSVAVDDSPPATTGQLNQPFAGSDFWLIDLGLDFLHWPKQRALRAEMMRSRPCRVLESINPTPAEGCYSRVISWVDNETGGILQAEAYDTRNKLVKKFALGPIKKIDGQWKLREMRIRNLQTRQQTELKFDLKDQ